MHNIPFISTIHKEIGKCNAEALHKIIESLNPEVIFLEAMEENYLTEAFHQKNNIVCEDRDLQQLIEK